ncbi:MAG: MBL fold metallo-hydrolase [Burkholderiaceae bacterium]
MGIEDRLADQNKDVLLYGWRDPVQPHPAATVILVRDGSTGLEIMMTRRSMQASFAPGAYVFPGGRVDGADHVLADSLSEGPSDDAAHRTTAYALAAIRESFEELGILFARQPDGQWPDAEWVNSLDRTTPNGFAQLLATHQLQPALDSIHWFTHWITDRDLPKRFDTRFFVAHTPPDQQPIADQQEQFEPVWVNPAEALARHEQGQFEMIFPTIRTLRHLLNYENAEQLLSQAATLGTSNGNPRWQSCPRAGWLNGEVVRFSENEAAYGELEMVVPDGNLGHTLDWQHEPVPLLKHVTRITAPNPGRMTGPGTNTYVISDAGQAIVIDPGPDHPEHLQRIASLVTGKLVAIICTHSHPDHYPGAIPLRKLLKQPDSPILGRLAGPNFNPAWVFEPDRELQDNDVIQCGELTLRALHTPGHASNHVCLLLESDELLFSGDHILNGSTTVIDHPDGSMLDYMNSLHRLRQEPVRFILPAHGYVLGQPTEQIDGLVRHRLKREAKVLSAVEQSGTANIDELVLIAYNDVDPVLHQVAKRSLTAHLVKLVEEERINHDPEQATWSARQAQ